jgi:hypothetical protein
VRSKVRQLAVKYKVKFQEAYRLFALANRVDRYGIGESADDRRRLRNARKAERA